MQIYRLDSWLQNVFFSKQEVYINIRGMHNDTDTDLAASLWWGSFCLLFVFGSQGGRLQYKISYSPWRADAATSCVVHYNCIFNFLKLQKEKIWDSELKFRKYRASYIDHHLIKIQRKISLPAIRSTTDYSFSKMEIGNAFTVHIRFTDPQQALHIHIYNLKIYLNLSTHSAPL